MNKNTKTFWKLYNKTFHGIISLKSNFEHKFGHSRQYFLFLAKLGQIVALKNTGIEKCQAYLPRTRHCELKDNTYSLRNISLKLIFGCNILAKTINSCKIILWNKLNNLENIQVLKFLSEKNGKCLVYAKPEGLLQKLFY